MLSKNKLSFLISVAFAAPIALAQVVPPPVAPPGVQSKAAVAAPNAQPSSMQASPVASAPASGQKDAVIAPAKISGVAAGAVAAPSGDDDLINIVLPPAPEKPPVVELKPKAPAAPKAASKAKSAKQAEKVVLEEDAVDMDRAAISEDPFLGIVGTPVSDSQINRFVFPEPVEGIYFQEGAPLPECPKDARDEDPCKPVFLNGRKMMLLQLRAGAKGMVQMLVHLQSGRMVTINLAPARGPGAVVRVEGAEDGASDSRLAKAKLLQKQQPSAMTSNEQDVALLSRFARGDIPGGFEPVKPGPAQRYSLFDVVPMATWDNGAGARVHMMQVVAHGAKPVAINPGLFRSSAVRALALDRDTITDKSPASLFVMEAVEVK